MYDFLFDILPDTGHVRVTLELAFLLHQKGHKVYYTNSSDSAFTSELIRKGIGRVYYPGDFHFFTPDMVLLDYALKERISFYRERNIAYMLVDMPLLNYSPEIKTGKPTIYLSPSAHSPVLPPGSRAGHLSDWLSTTKKDENNIIIIVLLEDEEPSPRLSEFYNAIKKSAITNTHYQIILLANDKESVGTLFPLPENMTIYRLMDLPSTLPFCDVALITGNLNTMIELIQFNVPAIVYPISEKIGHNYRAAQYAQHGFGIYGETKKITPEAFEQQIMQVIRQKEEIQEKLRRTKDAFKNDSLKLEWTIGQLIKSIKFNEQLNKLLEHLLVVFTARYGTK